MSNIKHISTLELYGYGENNNFVPVSGNPYKVKVSDSDGNIITVEKDGSLYAMVGLSLENGVLTLLDAAHENAELASVEFPNAGHIENCSYNEENGVISFNITTLNGETEAVEIDVQNLVDIYEEGQGIEFGEGSEEGKRTINIKLSDNEEILQLDDNGLSLSDEVITESELEDALLPFATIDYVDGEVEKINDTIGFVYDPDDEDAKTVMEMLDEKADSDELSDLDDEVGEILTKVNANETAIETLATEVQNIENGISDKNTELAEKFDEIDGKLNTLTTNVNALNDAIVDAQYDSDTQSIVFYKKDGSETEVDLADIFNDEISPITDVRYNATEKVITLVLTSGSEINIDMHDFLDIEEVGDGLQLDNNGTILVKIDEASDNCLTVSENGIKLSLDSLINSVEGAGESVELERARAIGKENELEGRIDTLSSTIGSLNDRITSNVTVLDGKINVFDGRLTNTEDNISNLNDNVSDLSDDVDELKGTITELSNTIASEGFKTDDLANSIDGKINAAVEAEKALREEADNGIRTDLEALTEKVNELDRTETPSEQLADAIAKEKADRETGDVNLQSQLDDNVNTLNDNVGALNRRVEALEDAGYVDEDTINAKDSSIYDAALADAKAYTDSKIQDELNGEGGIINQIVANYDEKIAQLNNLINELTTKLDKISNSDKTGELDVLHKEFDEYKNN